MYKLRETENQSAGNLLYAIDLHKPTKDDHSLDHNVAEPHPALQTSLWPSHCLHHRGTQIPLGILSCDPVHKRKRL